MYMQHRPIQLKLSLSIYFREQNFRQALVLLSPRSFKNHCQALIWPNLSSLVWLVSYYVAIAFSYTRAFHQPSYSTPPIFHIWGAQGVLLSAQTQCSFIPKTNICRLLSSLSFAVQKPDTFHRVNRKRLNFFTGFTFKDVCSFISHTHICKQCFPLSFAVQKPDTFHRVNKKWVNFSPSTFVEVSKKWVNLSMTSSVFQKHFYFYFKKAPNLR